MTNRSDVARGREIIERWCVLAEQRLDYLTDLFETGRWRRFHSERGFLENIQEAKTAVETWRRLASCEASPDYHSTAVSWFGGAPPRSDASRRRVDRPAPRPAEAPVHSLSFARPIPAEAD